MNDFFTDFEHKKWVKLITKICFYPQWIYNLGRFFSASKIFNCSSFVKIRPSSCTYGSIVRCQCLNFLYSKAYFLINELSMYCKSCTSSLHQYQEHVCPRRPHLAEYQERKLAILESHFIQTLRPLGFVKALSEIIH